MKHFLTHPVFKYVADVSAETNTPAYVIGGFVRDKLLNRPSKDLDFLIIGNGMQFAELVAQKIGKNAKVNVFKNFGTAQLFYQDWDIEFVGARKESYRTESRKPIVEDGSLQDDQNRRDFSINAMAISLNRLDYGNLIDPFNGLDDLKKKIIRTPLDADITYSDDPLRMMRAIRFASQLKFNIESESFEAI